MYFHKNIHFLFDWTYDFSFILTLNSTACVMQTYMNILWIFFLYVLRGTIQIKSIFHWLGSWGRRKMHNGMLNIQMRWNRNKIGRKIIYKFPLCIPETDAHTWKNFCTIYLHVVPKEWEKKKKYAMHIISSFKHVSTLGWGCIRNIRFFFSEYNWWKWCHRWFELHSFPACFCLLLTASSYRPHLHTHTL